MRSASATYGLKLGAAEPIASCRHSAGGQEFGTEGGWTGDGSLRDSRPVAHLLDRVVAVWTAVPAGDARDEAAFREVYTDPVKLNGNDVAIGELVERYRILHASFTDLAVDVVDRIETPGALAVVLRQRGRHVGPLRTPLGTVGRTGRTFEVLGIDVLTVDDERINGIWVVSDELGRLEQLEAVTLAAPATTPDPPDLR
jgi:SnoaL-like polyketide cyclase